ncbi:MAG: hypothetical protein IKN54_01110 [Lachnospiraceae bacterium]|nr:hypothetical protein [Lachnospiraceae bacterium]
MNNYPIWWDTTITIYNKFEDTQTHVVRWYRTKVDGAFWKYTGDKISVGKTILETNNTICRIRKDSRFLPKHEWITKPNDEMNNFFTLGIGDIIVKGEVDDEIDEYASGHRATDIEKKYKNLQGCIRIEETADNTGIGRCNEHYYVKGI